jgi:NAD(P)-dependent dehydrogenase (short-subunit alcohol dehydrogenase family)
MSTLSGKPLITDTHGKSSCHSSTRRLAQHTRTNNNTMGSGTVTLGVAAVVGLSAVFLRRRISSKWIDVRSDPTELPDKVVIITGGNVGLGYEAALDLARRKARVVLACRNLETGQAAAEKIRAQTGVVVECMQLDLADLASVRQFADDVKTQYPDIYALILNAGVWVPMDQKQKTKDGLEIHFGVNHLSHLELAKSLQGHMAKSKSASRIVFVASSLLRHGKIDFETQDFVREGREVEPAVGGDDKKQSTPFYPLGYVDSKLMNALTCKHLATLLPPHISTYSLCPGFCRSNLGRHLNFSWFKRALLSPVLRLIQRTTVQGAQNIVFCTISDQDKLQNGGLYTDGEISKEGTEKIEILGVDAPKKLWDLSVEILNEIK